MDPQFMQLLQKAVEDIQANKLISAQSLLNEVLQIEKNQPDALRFLGVIAALHKDWGEALHLINLAIASDPLNGVVHSNQGNILGELGRYEEALVAYEKAIALESNYAEAYSNKGNALQALGRHEEALVAYEKAIALESNYAEAYSNKGNALQALGRHEEALASYDKAVKIDGSCAQAFYGAAHIFLLRKKYDFALGCCNQALKINPKLETYLVLKGNIFYEVKDYVSAIAAFEEALLISPESSAIWMSKGNIHSELKQFQEAEIAFNKALAISPSTDFLFGIVIQNSLQMCKWCSQSSQLNKLVNQVQEGQNAAIPYNFISLLDDKKLIRRSIEIYAQAMQGDIERVRVGTLPQKEKIRLGYFSADFHDHPTAYLIAELFECHDKKKFELVAFVFGRNTPDAMRRRLEKSFDQFIDVNDRTDKEVAELSRQMQIDIAIDLKGFTGESRPKIFMYGAAPIQISYLAFPGTMGLSCFDYVVADPILIPEQAQDGMVEKIIYMPDSYQVNDRKRPVSLLKYSRSELGLPNSGFIFCCFNNNYKITPRVMDGWAKILNSTEGSVLWLFGDNPCAIKNLKMEAVKRNLNPDRLIFAPRIDVADHLARYKLADLFLDTSPCNAHTTASDALWAGLPVLTLIGESFAARVAASLLHAIGLSDLVANTQDQYESLAIELANQPSKLQEIKLRLENNLSTAPLFDAPLFTKNLEAAYIKVYDRYQHGLLPEHLYVD